MINDEELEQELNEDTVAETDVEVEQPETETEGDKVSEELAAVKDNHQRDLEISARYGQSRARAHGGLHR